MAKKKTYAEKFAATSFDEISSWSEKRMREELKQARYAVNRRLASFKSHNIASAAAIEYLGTGGLKPVRSTKSRSDLAKENRSKKPETMSRNQMYLELARIHSFFNAKTSTIKGQVEVNRAQDIAIFGTDAKGEPLYTMNSKEREDYWAVYMEFYNQNKNLFSLYGTSENVQKIIGSLQANGALDKERLNDMLDMIHKKYLKQEEKKRKMNRREGRRRGNVQRGRRNGRGR